MILLLNAYTIMVRFPLPLRLSLELLPFQGLDSVQIMMQLRLLSHARPWGGRASMHAVCFSRIHAHTWQYAN
jgi:hypothetical protein